MAVKTKAKPKSTSKTAVKSKGAAKKPVSAKKTAAKKSKVKEIAQKAAPHVKKEAKASKPAVIQQTVRRTINPLVERKTVKPSLRPNQFAFMKAPTPEHAFEVGDNVEVFCDHEKSRERVRGWIKGIVVQVDNKMVAVQFRSNVFLTDGWMVPDRILWYPLASEHIRPFGTKKAAPKKDFIPDY